MNCFHPHIEHKDFHQEYCLDFEQFQDETGFYLIHWEKDEYMH